MNHGSPTTRPQRHLQLRAVPSSIQPIIYHAHRSALRVVHFQSRQVLARHHQQSRLLCIDIPRSSHPRPGLDQQVPFCPSPRRLQTSPCTRDARLTLGQRSKGARVPIPSADPPSASPPFAFNILPGLIHGQTPTLQDDPSFSKQGHSSPVFRRLRPLHLQDRPRPFGSTSPQRPPFTTANGRPRRRRRPAYAVWRRVNWLRALDAFEVVPSPTGWPPISHVSGRTAMYAAGVTRSSSQPALPMIHPDAISTTCPLFFRPCFGSRM
ncbi:hypothetical protein CKAH01_09208 [Colletotrichum kahawae]|uniref:Uncharacterized protein n=1 Tax=Colletotrichum kahawae TaxID=34407 RepID=A0AAE0CYL7_COLKA|nr:hypothetical protein CKAH01_09208 [Colletotrichum kahawae]